MYDLIACTVVVPALVVMLLRYLCEDLAERRRGPR